MTARVVQQFNFYEIITKFSPTDFHPPLYYLFMKVWTNIFAYSEISLRMPSVLFSLLTGYIVYLIGKKLFNIDSGLASLPRMTKGQQFGPWAAVFFLFYPLIIYYSQEARMYMMATFLLTASLYFLLGIILNIKNQISKIHIKNQKLMNFVGFLSLTILSLMTFYGSIFLIIPMFLYLLFKKHYRLFTFSFLFFTFSLILISPLLSQQIINAKQQMQLIPNWGRVLGKTNFKNLFLIPIKFSIGRISFYPKWLYWSISGIWTAFLWFFVIKGRLKNRFLFFLLVGSLGFGILFSFFTPLLQYFRFLYLIPIMSILLALGWDKFHLRGGKWLVLTGFILFSLLYLLNPNFQREDWRSLAKALPLNRNVYMVYSSSDPIRYYRKEMQIVDLKSVPDLRCLDSELIVIPYSADIHGLDYQKILSERNFKLAKKQAFRALTVETWNYSSL